MSGASAQTHPANRRTVGAAVILGVAMTLTGCGSSGTPVGSSSTTRSGVVTTVPGGQAINAYAAQFGGEQIPLPKSVAGFKMRV